MEAEKEKYILDSSPEAASIQTVTGWVSSTGRFWGKDERMARFEGSTHRSCSACGVPVPQRGYTICDSCRAKEWNKKYREMPFRVWDEKSPVYSHVLDKYFFNGPDDIEEALDEYDEEDRPKDLQLVFCEPNHFQPVDFSYWEDVWPEDGEPSKEFQKKLEEFNAYVTSLPAPSYSPGKFRTEWEPVPFQGDTNPK